MRVVLILLASLALAGCTAMMVGGGASAGQQAGSAERSASQATADAAITTRVRGRLAADSVVSVFNIGVRTYNGTVTLYGTVGSILARDRAASLAKGTDGVRLVNNQIVIEDQSE
jgi:hyperosmotically inducible protein